MQATDPASSDSLADWLRLEQTPGVGCGTAARLLAHFGNPGAILRAGAGQLQPIVSERIARALAAPLPDGARRSIDAALAWREQPGRCILPLDHPDYPPQLRALPGAPILLYVQGRLDLLARPAVAIVGSRNATLQGVLNARNFGAALSQAGLGIVSGLALGIDAAAHEGGLLGKASTIAVIGTGIDRIYPRRNEALARRIAAEGCVVSEYPLGMGPLPNNFPRRNRIISGLACAVLVVEAAASSGSLITAQVAVEQGRDVLAIPGSIHAPLSKGCHALIRAGAKLVDTVEDVLSELQRAPLAIAGPAPVAEYDGEDLALLYALGHGPLDSNSLAALTDIDPGFLASQLLALELAGQVERLPGGKFQRIKGADGLVSGSS